MKNLVLLSIILFTGIELTAQRIGLVSHNLGSEEEPVFCSGVRAVTIATPFKFRPTVDINDINGIDSIYQYRNITPELTLGEGIAYRFALHGLSYAKKADGKIVDKNNLLNDLKKHSKEQVYLNLFGYGGLSMLNYNSAVNAAKSEDESTLAAGLTFAFGLNVEFGKTQIGVVMGKDYGLGPDGKDWIYNNRFWYSFSLGYRFLQVVNEDEE